MSNNHHSHGHDHPRNGKITARHIIGARHGVEIKAKNRLGLICIERHIHDEAIVISGSLTVEYSDEDLTAWIAEELEKAAREVKARNGIVGHIKTALTITTTEMVSVTDEKAMIAEAPFKRAKITLAAIMFLVEPQEAENIVRIALAGIRARLRQKKD